MNSQINVLIADETEEFGKTCGDELEKLGYHVTLCKRNGRTVIDRMETTQYDAVLMDVFMPQMNAIEVIEQVQPQKEKMPATILFSAQNNPSLEAQIINSGADYYFISPINAECVAKRVKDLIGIKNKVLHQRELDRQQELDAIISTMMHQIGVPAHIKGYGYLRTAVRLCVDEPEMLGLVTKILYPAVAKIYHTAPNRVERSMRHAIQVAWERGDEELIARYFGCTQAKNRKPTNSEFIATLSEELSFRMKSGEKQTH